MPQHNITLHSYTGRLKLIPPSAADDEAIATLRSDPTTRRYLRFMPEHISAEEVRQRREKDADDDEAFRFHGHLQIGDGSTTFVGSVALLNIDTLNDSCMVGILVSPDFHRGGIATELLYSLLKFGFEDRMLHRLSFLTGADNVMMQGWLENVLGVNQEFRMRECWKDGPGEYVDAVSYSIFDQEWKDTAKAKLEQRLAPAKSA